MLAAQPAVVSHLLLCQGAGMWLCIGRTQGQGRLLDGLDTVRDFAFCALLKASQSMWVVSVWVCGMPTHLRSYGAHPGLLAGVEREDHSTS